MILFSEYEFEVHMTISTKDIFAERLNSLIERMEETEGWKKFNSNRMVAEELNLSIGAIRKWRKGAAFPEVEALLQIASFFKCTVDYLLGNDDGGYELRALNTLGQPNGEAPTRHHRAPDFYVGSRVPILGQKHRGWVCVDYATTDAVFGLGGNSGNRFFMHAPSDSMWPTIRKGELILVDMTAKTFEENEILLVLFDGNLMVRRMQRRFGVCAVMSDNRNHYPEVQVDLDKIDFWREHDVGEPASLMDRVRDGMPLLDLIGPQEGRLVIVGHVVSCVRSLMQAPETEEFLSHSA